LTHLDREIAAQPEVLERLLHLETGRARRLAGGIRRAGIRTVLVVARGSSDHAGVYGKYLLGARNGLLVAMAAPSLVTLYRRPPRLSGVLVLAISQSGASEDLRQVVAEARRQGAPSLTLTNRPASPLARESDEVLPLHAGLERSIAATKTYTAELLALAMLSVALDGGQTEREALRRVPAAVAAALRAAEGVGALAERYRYAERLAVIGRGFNYATAFELALKLKELAYVTAEPASSADFRHGPIAVIQEGFPALLVAPRGRTTRDMLALAGELAARRAETLIISDHPGLLRRAHTPLRLPVGVAEWLSPIPAVVPGQLFARHLAGAKGCPVDRPRGLRKETITR
jgi:glucosamine--fructose-6-phosphate aminotransferase (isomerizing)